MDLVPFLVLFNDDVSDAGVIRSQTTIKRA
jgi:hypothetical protein